MLNIFDGEIFKPISGYNNLFEVSNFGRVKSFSRGSGKILKTTTDRLGYINTTLCVAKSRKFKLIHRLVAIEFISNPNKLKEVNHINGIKSDNRVANLEWCTRSENIKHSYRVLGQKAPTFWLGKKGGDHNCSRPVLQIDKLTGLVIKEHRSVSEASFYVGAKIQHISEVARGNSIKRKTAGGFKWIYPDLNIPG